MRVRARARQASPKAWKSAQLSASSVHLHSACHCTPIAKARALLTLMFGGKRKVAKLPIG